jgi:hypothetical protein
MIPEKLFVPSKTDSEKIQSINSSIESCVKIIRQELIKRAESTEDTDIHEAIASGMDHLDLFRRHYNLTKE